MADCAAHLGERTLAARIRDIDRRLRRLRERGNVAWRWHREAGATAESVESFLALEHMGWKGDEGSSLRSRPDDEAFFRAAVSGFASEGRALFIEVTFDGVPIASMCNFIAGNVGFGFKIGWNPAFRSYSPALINELELIRQGPTNFTDIEYFDSGASATSFINELWLARHRMAKICIPTGWVGASSIAAAEWAARLKRRGRSIGKSFAAVRVLDSMRVNMRGSLKSHAVET